jgi:hypothetical protein
LQFVLQYAASKIPLPIAGAICLDSDDISYVTAAATATAFGTFSSVILKSKNEVFVFPMPVDELARKLSAIT